MSLRRCAALALLSIALAPAAGCGGGMPGRQYEYEEDLVLDIDGSATLTVNASIPALIALRGLDLDPGERISREFRDTVRGLYDCEATDVTRVSRGWRRAGRQFIQVRMDVHDVRALDRCPPLAWSRYSLEEREEARVFRQQVGASALERGTLRNVGWNGSEIVAFRVHLPSKVIWHNSRDLDTNETAQVARGNILGWEQHLADRLDGRPIDIDVRMDRESILYRTLGLFAGAFAAAVAALALLIWLAIRKGRHDTAAGGTA